MKKWLTCLGLSCCIFPSLHGDDSIAPFFHEQITEDLAPFKEKGLSGNDLDATSDLTKVSFGIIRVRINQKGAEIVYGGSDVPCAHPRARLMINSLNEFVSFCKKLKLKTPSIEIILSLDDSFARNDALSAPIFTFAKDMHNGRGAVLIPDFEILKGYEAFDKIIGSLSPLWPWSIKVKKAVWRGASTGHILQGEGSTSGYTPSNYRQYPRTKLVECSLQRPELIDARFTGLCQGAEAIPDMKRLVGKSMEIEQQLPYKYQILLDGNSCSYSRAYWQLLSGCVVFKDTTSHVQWYYKGLLPNVHYIPLHEDLSDLFEQLQWARAHDKEAKQIADNAGRFARSHLSKRQVYLYLYYLFTAYQQLFDEKSLTLIGKSQ